MIDQPQRRLGQQRTRRLELRQQLERMSGGLGSGVAAEIEHRVLMDRPARFPIVGYRLRFEHAGRLRGALVGRGVKGQAHQRDAIGAHLRALLPGRIE